MTLYELGVEYEESAALLRARLRELRATLKVAATAEERFKLKRRIAELTPMLTSCNKTSEYLRRYYDKGFYIGNGPQSGKQQQFRNGDIKHRTIADCPMHIDKRTDRETTASNSRMSDKRSNVSKLSRRRRRKQDNYFQKLL